MEAELYTLLILALDRGEWYVHALPDVPQNKSL